MSLASKLRSAIRPERENFHGRSIKTPRFKPAPFTASLTLQIFPLHSCPFYSHSIHSPLLVISAGEEEEGKHLLLLLLKISIIGRPMAPFPRSYFNS